MLDECKGERLEEVLAVFSNAVLKKVLQEDPGKDGSIAKELALENFSYTGERTMLSTLILAHKASLGKHLREKNGARARVHDFEDLLDLNERRIVRRHEQLKEIIGERKLDEQLSRKEVDVVQRTVSGNWSGNERWLDEILYGAGSNEDGLLSTRFDKVWRHVEGGSIGELEGKGQTRLMEQLDARVKDQESRLAKWQAFGRKLEKSGQVSPSKKATGSIQPSKIVLGFNKHQQLQVSRSGSSKSEKVAPKLEEYSRLIDNMKAELEEVGKPQKPSKRPRQSLASERRRSSGIVVAKQPSPPPVADDGWSSASEPEETSPGFASYATKSLSQTPPSEAPPFEDSLSLEEPDFKSMKSISPPRKIEMPIRTMRSTPKAEIVSPHLQPEYEIPTRTLRSTPKQQSMPTPKQVDVDMPIRTLRPTPKQRSISPPIVTHPTSKILTYEDPEPEFQFKKPEIPNRLVQSRKLPSKPTILEERSISPLPIPQPRRTESPPKLTPPIDHEAELADQILNSMAAASPSPKKRHTLSLAERTRLSMSRNSHSQFSDLHDEFEIGELPKLSIKSRQSLVPKTPTEDAGEPQAHAALIERTRKSMAGFEASQQRAQLERRKSVKDEKRRQRQSSYFPKVNEEREDDTVKKVEMMIEEGQLGECEDVFKSRPKIAMSPRAQSPMGSWEEREEEGVDEEGF